MSLSKPSKEPTPPPTPQTEPQATDIPLPDSPMVLPPAESPFWTVVAQEARDLARTLRAINNDEDKIRDDPDSVSEMDADNTSIPKRDSATEKRSVTPLSEASEEHQTVELDDDTIQGNLDFVSDTGHTNSLKRNPTSTSEERSITPPPDQTMDEQGEPSELPEPLRNLPKIPAMLAKLSQRITDFEAAEEAENNSTCSALLERQQKLHDATSSLLLDALAVASVVMAEGHSHASIDPSLIPLPSDNEEEDDIQSEESDEHTPSLSLPSFTRGIGGGVGTGQQQDDIYEDDALLGLGSTDIPFPPSLTVSEYDSEFEEQETPSLVPQFIADNLEAQGKDHHLPDTIPTCTAYDDIDWTDLLPAPVPEDSSSTKAVPSSSSDIKSSLAVQVDPADVPLPEDDPFGVPRVVDEDDGYELPDHSDFEASGDHGDGDHGTQENESDSSQLFVDDRSPLPDRRQLVISTSSEDEREANLEESHPKGDAEADGDDSQPESLLEETVVAEEKRPSKEEKGKGKAEQQPEQMLSPRSPVSPYSSVEHPVALAPPIAPAAPMGSVAPIVPVAPFSLDHHMGADQLPPSQSVVIPEQQPEPAPFPRGTQGQPTTPPTAHVPVYVGKATEPRLDRYSPLPAPSSPLLSRSSPCRAYKSSQPLPRESLLHSVPYTPAVVPWDEQKDLRGLPPLPDPERLPTYTRISKTTDNSRVMPMWFEGFNAQEWLLIEPSANIMYRRIRNQWHPSLPQWPPCIIGPTPLIMELSQIGKDGLAGEINILLHCERYSPPGFLPCPQLRSFTNFIRDCLALQNIRGITVPDFQTVHECKIWLETVTKNGRMLSFMALHCHVERLRSGVLPGTHEFLDAIRDMGCQLGWNENVYFSKTLVLQEFRHVPKYDSTSTPFSLRGNQQTQNLGQYFGYGQGKTTDYCIALRDDHPHLNIRVTLAALNTLNFEWLKWVGPPDAWVKTWDPCDEVVGPQSRTRLAQIRLRRKDLYDEFTALNGRVDGWFEDHPEPPRTALIAGGMASRLCACRQCHYAICHQQHHDDESVCECDDETPSSSGNSSPGRTRPGGDGLQPLPRSRPLPDPPRPGFSSLAYADGESLLTKEELTSMRRAEEMMDRMDRKFDKNLEHLNPPKRRKTEAAAERAEAIDAEAEEANQKAAEPDTRTEAQKERQRRRNRKKKEQEKEAKKKKAARSEVVAESKAQILESLKTGGFDREAIKNVVNETMAKIGPKPGAPEDKSRGQALANKGDLSTEEVAHYRNYTKSLYADHLKRKEAGESTKLFGKFEVPADISEEGFFDFFLNNLGIVETDDRGAFAIIEEGTGGQDLLDSKCGGCIPEDAHQDAVDNELGQASIKPSPVNEQDVPAETVKHQPKNVHSTAGPSTHDVPDHDTDGVVQPKQLGNIASADIAQPSPEQPAGPEATPKAAPNDTTAATPNIAPTDTSTPSHDLPNHDANSTSNPPPFDRSKEASKAKKERRKLRKRLDREKEEARLREQAAAREELRRQAEARHQAELDQKVAEAQRKLDEEKARRLEQHQKEEIARLQRVKEEEAHLQKVKEEEANRKEEDMRKREEEERLAEEEKKRQEEERRKDEERQKEEERIAEEKRRQFEEEARLQAEKEWYAKEEQRKLKEANQKEEARRIALEAKQKAGLEARQKAKLEAIRLAEMEAKRKAEEEREAEQKRKAAEAKRKADEAKKAAEEVKKKAEEVRRQAEEEVRLKQEEEAKRKAEEKKRQAEVKRLAEKKRKAEAARQAEEQQKAELKRQAEVKRLAEKKRKADEAARQAEAELHAELQRQADEAERRAQEAAQKARAALQAELQQEARQRKAAEAKKRAAEAKKKAVEEVERRRLADLEAAARRAKEEEQRRLREEAERLKREAQAVRKAEEEAIRRAMEEARVRREEEARIRREKEDVERLKKEVKEARERAKREEAMKKAADEVKRRKKAQRKAEAEAKRKAEAEAAQVKAEGEAKLGQMLGIQQVDNSLTLAEQKATPFHEQQMLLQEAWHQIDESLILSQQAHNSLLRAQHHNSEAFRQLGEADLLLSLSQDVSQDCQNPQDSPNLILARLRFDEAILQAQEGYRLLQEAWDYHDSSTRTAEQGHRLLVEVSHDGEYERSAAQYSLVEARHQNDEAFRRAEEGRSVLEKVFTEMGIPLHHEKKEGQPLADRDTHIPGQEPGTIPITAPPATHHQLSDPEADADTETASSSFESMSTTTSGDQSEAPTDNRPYEERLAAFINNQLLTYGVWDPESFYVRYDPRNPNGPRAHEMPVMSERERLGDAAGSGAMRAKEAWW
ncbi:uncharacterized protein B0T23DRAFT_319736 [Neurospora hispaniola]|uniref:Uncharacterized protein n=1 Tax=Neurospora hispaniola TaxID=588809 RepID=A0AAJ0I6X1_9PEZI|nr:hypothetical protein B0T23DRAFT_319736 [Neurospora hispaniola]